MVSFPRPAAPPNLRGDCFTSVIRSVGRDPSFSQHSFLRLWSWWGEGGGGGGSGGGRGGHWQRCISVYSENDEARMMMMMMISDWASPPGRAGHLARPPPPPSSRSERPTRSSDLMLPHNVPQCVRRGLWLRCCVPGTDLPQGSSMGWGVRMRATVHTPPASLWPPKAVLLDPWSVHLFAKVCVWGMERGRLWCLMVSSLQCVETPVNAGRNSLRICHMTRRVLLRIRLCAIIINEA